MLEKSKYEGQPITVRAGPWRRLSAEELMAPEKTLRSPLNTKEIEPVNPGGNQPWIFIGRTEAEAKDPILWPTDAKSQLIGKDPDAGKDWGQEEKGTTEDEMVGWHHRLSRHESEPTPGECDGQGSLEYHLGLQRVRHDLATEQQHRQ